MITTTLAVVALAGAFGAGNSPSPNWQTDYPQAIAAATADHKPVAVFLGQTSSKLNQMIADGTIPADAAKLLREKYVCVSLTADTAEGKDLAGRVKMEEGLVIETPTGSVQALRHASAVNGPDLTRQLGQFATLAQPVVATNPTIVNAAPAAYSAVRTCATGNCPLNASTTYTIPTQGVVTGYAPAQTYAPVYPTGYQFAPAASPCASGRCPLQR